MICYLLSTLSEIQANDRSRYRYFYTREGTERKLPSWSLFNCFQSTNPPQLWRPRCNRGRSAPGRSGPRRRCSSIPSIGPGALHRRIFRHKRQDSASARRQQTKKNHMKRQRKKEVNASSCTLTPVASAKKKRQPEIHVLLFPRLFICSFVCLVVGGGRITYYCRKTLAHYRPDRHRRHCSVDLPSPSGVHAVSCTAAVLFCTFIDHLN